MFFKNKYLTRKVEAVAAHYFPADTEWAIDQLKAYCEYMEEYISKNSNAKSYERFCFAILKVGKTSKEKFLRAIELGKSDYRDLLVTARFANSTTIHNDWATKILKINET